MADIKETCKWKTSKAESVEKKKSRWDPSDTLPTKSENVKERVIAEASIPIEMPYKDLVPPIGPSSSSWKSAIPPIHMFNTQPSPRPFAHRTLLPTPGQYFVNMGDYKPRPLFHQSLTIWNDGEIIGKPADQRSSHHPGQREHEKKKMENRERPKNSALSLRSVSSISKRKDRPMAKKRGNESNQKKQLPLKKKQESDAGFSKESIQVNPREKLQMDFESMKAIQNSLTTNFVKKLENKKDTPKKDKPSTTPKSPPKSPTNVPLNLDVAFPKDKQEHVDKLAQRLVPSYRQEKSISMMRERYEKWDAFGLKSSVDDSTLLFQPSAPGLERSVSDPSAAISEEASKILNMNPSLNKNDLNLILGNNPTFENEPSTSSAPSSSRIEKQNFQFEKKIKTEPLDDEEFPSNIPLSVPKVAPMSPPCLITKLENSLDELASASSNIFQQTESSQAESPQSTKDLNRLRKPLKGDKLASDEDEQQILLETIIELVRQQSELEDDIKRDDSEIQRLTLEIENISQARKQKQKALERIKKKMKEVSSKNPRKNVK
uniref:Uncharacterized protein n=1 Tax=Acrobeloides nanus TaxID=290746 RepID=A0A914DN65_9BILA